MPQYLLTIDVRKIYTIEVIATSDEEARVIGNSLQSSFVQECGSLREIETEVIDLEEVE